MAKKNNQNAVVITGMHRSGTSLVASVLQSGGVNIGTDLQGPGHGNLRGHFEDKTFQEFHEKVLNRNNASWLTKKAVQNPEFNTTETKRAKAIIAPKSSESLWGWKDPRTSLFLEPWQKLLGDKARFVFVYRHPVEVILSLMKREHHEILVDPLLSLETWQIYNQSILKFYKEQSNTSVLVNISAITSNFNELKTTLAKKLGLKLDFRLANEIYAEGELNQLSFSESALAVFDKLSPDSQAVFNELESFADLTIKQDRTSSDEQNQKFSKLEQLIENLQNQNLFRSEARSDIFSLFLNMISPETILPTKRALARLYEKRNQSGGAPASRTSPNLAEALKDLETQLANERERSDQLTQQSAAEIESQSKKNDLLKQQLIDQKKYLLQLEQQNKQLEAQLQQKIELTSMLEKTLADQENEVSALKADEKINSKRLEVAEELYKHNEGLVMENELQLSKKDSHINWLEQELETLNNSLSLKVGRKLYPLRRLSEKVTGNKTNGQH